MKRKRIPVTKPIKKGLSLGKRFSGHTVKEALKVSLPNPPKISLAIGKVLGIIYETVRDGRHENYKHMFKASSRPLFAVSNDGKQLLLIGGSYNFTSRGIVDK